jgi:hypothetical protein
MLGIAAALPAGTGAAFAKMGGCTLQVDGRTYLDGPCNIDLEAGGDFSIGTGGADRSRFFAYVARDPDGTAQGHWNGTGSGSHAHDSLGQLRRQEACWVNGRAKVCARAAP